MGRARALRQALAVMAVVVAGGCGGGGQSDDASSPSTTGAGPTSTLPGSDTSSSDTSSSDTSGSDTSVTAPTATGTAPPPAGAGACPGDDAVPPAGATDVEEASADVDGDGRDDRVLTYRRADGERRVAVALAAGGTAAVDAGGIAEGPSPLRALGGADLGGDGETVFAVTGAGASVVVVGLFQFVECALSHVTFSSGQPVELPVGGGVTHGDGIGCTDDDGGGLVVRRATSSDGETFNTSETRYRVDGNTLLEVGSESSSRTRAADATALGSYYTLDCPTLEHGLGG